jgi:hypothetical protein
MLHGADCACGPAPSVTVLFLRGNPAQRRITGLRLGPDSPQPQSISPAGLSPASRANVPNPPNQQPKHPPFCTRMGWTRATNSTQSRGLPLPARPKFVLPSEHNFAGSFPRRGLLSSPSGWAGWATCDAFRWAGFDMASTTKAEIPLLTTL